MNQINRYYSNHFITLTEGVIPDAKSEGNVNLPGELTEHFYPKELEKIDKGLIWIKAEFPMILPTEVIDDLFCSMNCFPVINRRLTEFTQSAGNFLTIIPLFTDDTFLDIKKVSGERGGTFSAKTLTGSGEFEKGTYIIRHGGVARFDSRNASEILQYLMELVRDEIAAFSVIGTDMISSNLKELNQTIARLEQRLQDSQVVKEDVSYLMLKSHSGDDLLFIEFWTTNGSFANKIKLGEMLTAYEGSDLLPDSISFVTPTVGGKERMNTEERINAYRKALLSHKRVVSSEDIKTLCYEHFGNNVKNVEVKKGIQAGLDSSSGFIRTIDITLNLSKSLKDCDHEELEFMKKDLMIKLEEQSAGILPYRLIVAQE